MKWKLIAVAVWMLMWVNTISCAQHQDWTDRNIWIALEREMK